MLPTKVGQIVKFHTPLPDEDPGQLHVTLEIKKDDERSRADIRPLKTGLSYPPVNTVRIIDLEVVKVSTQDLIGHQLTINKSDYSQVEGKVINVREQNVILDLAIGNSGIETNVLLTVVDKTGQEHTGVLFVN